MGIHHLSKDVQDEAEELGMTEEAVLGSLFDFLSEQELTADLTDHLRDAAEDICTGICDDDDLQEVLDKAAWDDGTIIMHVANFLETMDLEDDFDTYFIE
jgi:hypothetical protein